MEETKAVIFDMDGVILDSETICEKAWLQAGAEFGMARIRETAAACLGTNLHDTREILFKIYGRNFDADGFVARTSALFHEEEDKNGIPLKPGALEILGYLKPKFRLALASSTKGETVRRQLRNAGVLDFFETLTTGESVLHSKPDPEIYRMACGSLNLGPEFCAAVEDSPNGVRSAAAAGIRTVMIPDRIAPSEEMRRLAWRICGSLNGLREFL